MKRILLFLVLGMYGCLAGRAEDIRVIKLWKDVPGIEAKGKFSWSEMSVYLPSADRNTGMAVVLCPGGSYCYLGMRSEGHRVAAWLQKNGIAAFVLRYRVGILGNRHPAMLQDLQRALQLVRENADIWNLDPHRTGVMGFSAGGHLAGSCAVYGRQNFMEPLGLRPMVSLRPDFVAMIYPVVSMQDSLAHKKSRRNLFGKGCHKPQGQPYADMLQRMSLELNIPADMPPVFLLQCKDDPTVDYRNAVVLDQALEKADLPHRTLFYQKGGHGFGIKPKKSADSYNWKEALLNWLLNLSD